MTFPLNEPQRAAVRYLDGPLLVLAGAGSGKTRVITAKIAHLIAQGFEPASIAAITFTNKAAREMRERATALLRGEGGEGRATARGNAGGSARGSTGAPTICTFHSLGLRIVRSEAASLGLVPQFSILDPSDIEGIIGELLSTTDRSLIRATQWKISAWKNALVSPGTAAADAVDVAEHAAAKVYERYGDALRAYQAVDFDDLIALPIAALENDDTACERWRAKLAYLLVDEYQDTNPAQYRLLKLLTGARAAFTAVGDDDQAIYGWRGATLANLEQLPQDYPSLKVIKLEQNYRSAIRILRSANALIAQNPKLFEKKLWTELGLGDPIHVSPATDDEAEAEDVVRRLLAHKFERRGRFADFAILYRGNFQSRVFERALSAQNVPYEVSGGQSWFERTEIRDLIAYLRLIANADDNPAFVRAVTTPKRGIGGQTLDRLGQIGSERGVSLFAAMYEDALTTAVPGRQREALGAFGKLVNDFALRAPREPAGRLLAELLKEIGYEDYLQSAFDKGDAKVRWDSVNDFVDWLSRKGEDDGRNLLELTQMITLITLLDGQEGSTPDVVRLSTLHAAKGLEFPHVFLVGLEEGILPHREAVATGVVDEERRLMYVGITRAQQSLRISWCRKRKRAGEWFQAEPSRFIGELAQEDLRYAGVALTGDAATEAKDAGNARLKSLRAMLSR